jgi:rubrerythrin
MLYLRKRDLLREMKDLRYCIEYNTKKIEDLLQKGDQNAAQIYGCSKSISELQLNVLEEIFENFYKKGKWQCPKCHRQIQTEQTIEEGAKRCPKCSALLELDGRIIEYKRG